MKKLPLTVIMPALNEEESISRVLDDTIAAFKSYDIDGEIIVVNDGSQDKTFEMAENHVMRYPDKISIISHDVPKGIGASFWDGVGRAKGSVVCIIPADNEISPGEIFRYYSLIEHVDMVIPFVFNREVRSPCRNIFSSVYHFMINLVFAVNVHYVNGAVLYRKTGLEELEHRSKGFFFQADILIRLIKRGYLFAEVPYRLGKRECGVSKSISFCTLMQVLRDYARLTADIYFKKGKGSPAHFPRDSATAARKQNDKIQF